MNLRRIDNIVEAEQIWNKLSPNLVLNDRWDFRYCFYKYFNYELFFYTCFDNDEPVALLPLQYNTDENHLEFFGDFYIEDNRVFLKPGYDDVIPKLYEHIDRKAKLIDMVGDDDFTKALPIVDYKYILELENIKDYEDYIEEFFEGKSRKNIKREIRILKKNKIEVLENRPEDMNLMVDLSLESFGEDSYFTAPYSRETFNDLLKLPLESYLMTFVVNGNKEAVSFGIFYKDVYTYITSASNKAAIPNLGKYVNLLNVQKAIDLGARIFDAGLTHSNWKDRWGLTAIPEHQFLKD